MIGPIETIRDSAKCWECDENDHINIAFYGARLDSAVRAFLVQAGWQVPHRWMRLIRFHSELRGGEPVHGTSGLVQLPDGRVAIEHRLHASARQVLSATALDVLPDVERADLSAFDLPMAGQDALPRSAAVPGNGVLHGEGVEALPQTYCGTLPPHAFGAPTESVGGAMLLDQQLLRIVSDGATHAWGHAGVDDEWLRQRSWGRAAVQLEITYGARPQAGDVVAMRTAIVASSAKTISYQHFILNLMNDTQIAQVRVTSLMLDLATRRAMPLPADLRARLEGMVAGGQRSY
jgi:acyl-CoA thioester hydrolase